CRVLSRPNSSSLLELPASLPANEHRTPATSCVPPKPPRRLGLPLGAAPAAARVDELRGGGRHAGVLELLLVAEPAGDTARVGLHRGRLDALARELLDEPVGPSLRADEDERRVVALDVLDQRLDLRVGRDRDELVLDLRRLRAVQLALDLRGAVRVGACELA